MKKKKEIENEFEKKLEFAKKKEEKYIIPSSLLINSFIFIIFISSKIHKRR
jgi:hypothetical protein